MATRRMGQILGEIASLNAHDVEEVLHEQKVTHQRFGETALSLGLVQPAQILRAWIEQLRDGHVGIDLAALGVDSQAAQHLPAADARRLNVIPIRVLGNDLVFAVTTTPDQAMISFLAAATAKSPVFAVADAAAIRSAIAKCYSASAASFAA